MWVGGCNIILTSEVFHVHHVTDRNITFVLDFIFLRFVCVFSRHLDDDATTAAVVHILPCVVGDLVTPPEVSFHRNRRFAVTLY